MIAEIKRDQFLASPQRFASTPCLIVAAVSGQEAESDVMAGWATMKAALNGAGTRVGYRAFVALIQDTEAKLKDMVAGFVSDQPSLESWRFVAASVDNDANMVTILREVEWRAHKNVDAKGSPPLVILEVRGAL